MLNLGAVWPANMRARSAAEFLYVTGYGDAASNVPQAIRMGMMIHLAALYEQRGMSADGMDIPPARSSSTTSTASSANGCDRLERR